MKRRPPYAAGGACSAGASRPTVLARPGASRPAALAEPEALRLPGGDLLLAVDTTEANRWASRNMDRPFTILGLNL
jgi:hypothetical protein